MSIKKTALILGASGLTGSLLLERLLNDERYVSIKLFCRTKIYGLPPKVTQYTGNLLKLETFKADFTGDEVFCCIGTTAKKTPDKSVYKAIDHGIPLTAAKLAKANGIKTFAVISSVGAHPERSVFYSKTKGEMERDVFLQNIKHTYILQPAMIDGNRKEQRLGESLGLFAFKIIQPLFFGKLKPYKITKAEHIAVALINVVNTKPTLNIITSDQIKKIALNKDKWNY
jgi:uncharacterized protein YbjT (DUF2867 family)